MDTNLKTRLQALVSKPTVLALIVFLIGMSIFLPTLGYDFVWDDLVLIKDNAPIKSFSQWPRLILSDIYMGQQYSFFYRPLVLYSFSFDYLLFQGNPWGFHFTAALLHGINAALVAYLAFLLFADSAAALIAGAFFALHPVHTEAVTFLSARADLLSTLFSLLFLVIIIKHDKQRPYLYFCLLAPLFFFLALLSKETSAVLLILMALVLLSHSPEEVPKGRKLILKILPCLLVFLPYMILRYLVLKTFFTTNLQLIRFFSPFFLVELFLRYLSLLILPFQRVSFLSYADGQPYPLNGKFWALAGLTLLVLIIIAYVIYRKRETLLLFALLLLPLLPSFYYNLYNDTIMAERYLYLASAGLALLLGWGFLQLPPGKKKWAGAGMVLLLAVYGGMTLWRAPLWRDEVILFEAFRQEYPRSSYIHSTLGAYYQARNRLPEAYQELSAAVRLDPENSRHHVALGWLYLKLGMTEKARQAFIAALIREPNHAPALEGMGVTLMQEGDYEKALKYLDQAYEINPRRTSILKNKALVLYLMQSQPSQ